MTLYAHEYLFAPTAREPMPEVIRAAMSSKFTDKIKAGKNGRPFRDTFYTMKLATNAPDSYSAGRVWSRVQGSSLTRDQSLELLAKDLEKMSLVGLPMDTCHKEQHVVGEVVADAWVPETRTKWGVFGLYQDQGKDIRPGRVESLIRAGKLTGVSLTHVERREKERDVYPSIILPIGVAICKVGARAGSGIFDGNKSETPFSDTVMASNSSSCANANCDCVCCLELSDLLSAMSADSKTDSAQPGKGLLDTVKATGNDGGGADGKPTGTGVAPMDTGAGRVPGTGGAPSLTITGPGSTGNVGQSPFELALSQLTAANRAMAERDASISGILSRFGQLENVLGRLVNPPKPGVPVEEKTNPPVAELKEKTSNSSSSAAAAINTEQQEWQNQIHHIMQMGLSKEKTAQMIDALMDRNKPIAPLLPPPAQKSAPMETDADMEQKVADQERVLRQEVGPLDAIPPRDPRGRFEKTRQNAIDMDTHLGRLNTSQVKSSVPQSDHKEPQQQQYTMTGTREQMVQKARELLRISDGLGGSSSSSAGNTGVTSRILASQTSGRRTRDHQSDADPNAPISVRHNAKGFADMISKQIDEADDETEAESDALRTIAKRSKGHDGSVHEDTVKASGGERADRKDLTDMIRAATTKTVNGLTAAPTDDLFSAARFDDVVRASAAPSRQETSISDVGAVVATISLSKIQKELMGDGSETATLPLHLMRLMNSAVADDGGV